MSLRYSEEELEETLKNTDVSVHTSQLKPHPLPALAAAIGRRAERNNEEDQLLRRILKEAKQTGWITHHTRAAWTSKGYRTPIQGDKGFVDIVLVREGQYANDLLFIEVKSSIGKLSIEQTLWKTLLEKTLVEYYIWRPSDWEVIKARLA